ncbi:MAG TPA: DUF3592 domain-containing protein [Lacunisphaera sp.]|nr:DUF3592 domain-containing protein [Lacunisphaera sp.]
MRPALRPSRTTLREWVSRHPAVAIGGFLSGIFLLLGLIGTLAFFPAMRIWAAAADWPGTEAEITGSRVFYGQRGRGGRPEFTFTYTWQGRNYTAQGYDLIGAYTRGTSGGPHRVLDAHPVGSRTTILVNPDRPSQAVLTRGSTGGVVLLFVPPLFVLLGSIGMFFTVITGLGWLEENTRHPLGRVIRAGGEWFVQEKVLKPFFFVIVGGIVVGLVALGVSEGNYLIVGTGAFIAWGVWRAARPPTKAGRGRAR